MLLRFFKPLRYKIYLKVAKRIPPSSYPHWPVAATVGYGPNDHYCLTYAPPMSSGMGGWRQVMHHFYHHLLFVMIWLLAPTIYPASSGSQQWVQILSCCLFQEEIGQWWW
jgi:hypothetical protein